MNVRPGGEVDLDIILPGTWYWIPVDDGEEIRKQCRLVIRRQLGVSDRLASRRREVAEQLVAAAKDAKAAGAVSFAMALELAPGVPFPASLMMNFSDWPTASTGDVDSRFPLHSPPPKYSTSAQGPSPGSLSSSNSASMRRPRQHSAVNTGFRCLTARACSASRSAHRRCLIPTCSLACSTPSSIRLPFHGTSSQ